MSLFTILETLLIGPLKLVFEIIFSIANRLTNHPGLAIIALSLVMNILVLPLYRQADAMQEKARDTEAKLRDGVAHIKKTFSGDERMMILQTYYRQNHYRPTDALNGSVSLLLEIPFFMAAYQFLSHADIFHGVTLGPISDLGSPDGLLVIGNLAINLLPILMTTINCISSALFLKGFPLKTKVQLYGMALFFLVFLYNSPACLVFYWTLNNLFSLVKTIFYKLKDPQKVLRYMALGLGLAAIGVGLRWYSSLSVMRAGAIVLFSMVLIFYGIAPFLKSRLPSSAQKKPQPQADRRIFWIGALFLTVLTGVLIPSAVIAASPQEFVSTSYFYHPLWFVANALCLSAGTFLVWMGVFYWLASPRGKCLFQQLVWVLWGVMLVNYLFFGTNLGILSSTLQYDNGLSFSPSAQLLNLLVVLAVALSLYVFLRRYRRNAVAVLLTALIAIGSMSVVNVAQITDSVNKISTGNYDKALNLPLSKTGKNVVVIMLDRALGEYVPYLFHEKPELQEKFDGFTHYSHTISFGGFTNFGSPALLGGYEYTPVEMNKRGSEPLVSKQNEALKVMPTLFADNGYQVTVCDPTYANYQWIPDLSIYEDDPRIQAFHTNGVFLRPEQQALVIQSNCRNFFVYGIMKSLPLCFQAYVYNKGNYNQVAAHSEIDQVSNQTVLEGFSRAEGMTSTFLNSYYVLQNLPGITTVTDDETGTFLFLSNDTTHVPMLLQEPDYTPSEIVDNTAYDAANVHRFTVDGKTLKVENERQMGHYQSNMAAMLTLANWFDYLREQDVYDNTRIILVSDHGQHLGHLEEMVVDHPSGALDLELYFPLLMVKDFDCHGFTTSEAFMTNADVPTLAMDSLIKDPVNPFTGKAINSAEKQAHDQFIILSYQWSTSENCGNTFLPAYWASVREDPWNLDNWTFYDEICALDRHAAP